jgi:hypothetical protein
MTISKVRLIPELRYNSLLLETYPAFYDFIELLVITALTFYINRAIQQVFLYPMIQRWQSTMAAMTSSVLVSKATIYANHM